jgi:hypothetical protein
MSQTLNLKFKLEKETKGALKYAEVNEAGDVETVYHAVGSLYLRKTAIERGAPVPKTLTVTVVTE